MSNMDKDSQDKNNLIQETMEALSMHDISEDDIDIDAAVKFRNITKIIDYSDATGKFILMAVLMRKEPIGPLITSMEENHFFSKEFKSLGEMKIELQLYGYIMKQWTVTGARMVTDHIVKIPFEKDEVAGSNRVLVYCVHEDEDGTEKLLPFWITSQIAYANGDATVLLDPREMKQI